MGKRNLDRITGLTLEQRIEAAIKRKAEEEKKKREFDAKVAAAMLTTPFFATKGANGKLVRVPVSRQANRT